MKRIIASPPAIAVLAVLASLLAPALFPGRAPARSEPPIVIDNAVLGQSDVELFTSYSEDPDPEGFFGLALSRGGGMERALAVMTKFSLACSALRGGPDPAEWRAALGNWPESMTVEGVEFKIAFTDAELDLLERDAAPLETACGRISPAGE